MSNNIKIINDFLHVSFKNQIFYFDECRIYEDYFIEFYFQNNFMMSIECKSIEIQKIEDKHYYLKLTYDEGHFGYDYIYLILKDDSEKNISCNVGDFIIRKTFNTIKGVNTSYQTYRDENITGDSGTLFLLGLNKESNIFNKFSDEAILENMGWQIIEVVSSRIVKIKRKEQEVYELIKNIDNLDNIKKGIETFKNNKDE